MGVAIRYKLHSDKSAEMINTAFLKAVTNLDKFEPTHSFQSWIKRIMVNTVIDDIRKQQRNMELAFDPEVIKLNEQTYDYNTYIKNENLRELLSMLEQLPPATRYVFNLFAIEGYAHKEIAEELGIAVETSKWHVKHARKLLREEVAKVMLEG